MMSVINFERADLSSYNSAFASRINKHEVKHGTKNRKYVSFGVHISVFSASIRYKEDW
jgi:hypothetical protein